MSTLSISNLRAQIEETEVYLAKLRARTRRYSASHKKHMILLRRLKSKALCLSSDKFKADIPNYAPELGVEWYGFNTAMHRCVRLDTNEWFLTIGYNKLIIPAFFTFTFNVELDTRIIDIIKVYKPNAKYRVRMEKLISSDVATALLFSQVIAEPKNLQWMTRTKQGRRSAHKRYYDRVNLKGVRLCRYA